MNIQRFPRQRGGFTLLELLITLAVAAILFSLSLPAVTSLTNSGNVNSAANKIALLLGQARAVAMANETYVWVGFAQDSTAQTVTVSVVSGNTGEIGDLNSTATYSPISRPQKYDHLSLKDIDGLTGMSSSADDITASQVNPFQQTIGGKTIIFTNVLQFSPQGEVTIDKNGGSSHWIKIGLQPIRGNNLGTPDTVVFQVAALTGQVQVFRP